MTPESTKTAPFEARKALGHMLLVGLCFVSLFPLYWMVNTAFTTPDEVLSLALVPLPPTLENFLFVLEEIPFGAMLANTTVMALLLMVGHVLIGILSGYAFARWKFWGADLLFLFFVGTWLIPQQVVMIPNYVLLTKLGWMDSMVGLVVPQLATAFGIILMRQHMKGFPSELIDATRMDGAGSWSTLWRIVVPNMKAPIFTLCILMFISGWNEYFWPMLIIKKIEHSVLQVGLQMFLTQEGDLWGPLMAASVLATVPIFILYVVLQKQVVDAFVRSGIK